MTLADALPGRIYQIQALAAGLPESLRDLGLYAGAEVSIVAKFPLRGPLILELQGSKVAIARQVAAKIAVKQSRGRSGFKHARARGIL